MQPVLGRHLLDHDAAAQYRLPDQGHHHGMLHVVIERVARRDPLDRQLGHGPDGGTVVGLALAVDQMEIVDEMLGEGAGEHGGGFEHRRSPGIEPLNDGRWYAAPGRAGTGIALAARGG